MTTIRKLVTSALFGASLLALAACSEPQDSPADQTEMAVSPPQSEAAADSTTQADGTAVPVTLPRMAYVFDYSFRLPDGEIAALQMRHADMCEALGPTRCMIVGMTSTGGEEDEQAGGTLELAVASDRARGFVGELSAIGEGFHGEQTSARITGEDLSASIVDTEAHLRSRTELRDRLLEVLRTHRGSVEDLVKAEQQVAAINQEIDAARSMMAELRGRVAMSRVRLTYASNTPVGSDFLGPVKGALGSLGSILGVVVAVMILLAGVVGPFVLGALGLRHWQRRKSAQAG